MKTLLLPGHKNVEQMVWGRLNTAPLGHRYLKYQMKEQEMLSEGFTENPFQHARGRIYWQHMEPIQPHNPQYVLYSPVLWPEYRFKAL